MQELPQREKSGAEVFVPHLIGFMHQPIPNQSVLHFTIIFTLNPAAGCLPVCGDALRKIGIMIL
ncbi:hypothetical protein [Pseudochrobactrum sp. HB0163]|uniref:hypothetical protein n=1 Tax=Pseudochrobactrum sp. HB0163 TaxID=3450708 RepID=UPI003F6DC903